MIELRCQAVLFDMDGTIIDSTASADKAWNVWSTSVGLPEGAWLNGDNHGVQRPDVVRNLMPHYSDDEVAAAAESIRVMERDDTDGVISLAGSAALLESLPRHRWGIVTSCDRETCEARLAAAGLPVPDVIISADEATRSKPDPMGYLMGADALGFAPEDCVVMEDAPAGLAAAVAAGMRTVVTRHTTPEEALTGAVAIVDDPSGVELVVDADGLLLRLS